MADEEASRFSPQAAVDRAFWMVNGPVLLVMLGPAVALFVAGSSLGAKTPLGAGFEIAAGFAFLVCWPLAWLTWSILIPHWRIWAYERVQDIEELKRLAVEARVIWPEGHIFQRTEICPRALRKRLEDLEANR